MRAKTIFFAAGIALWLAGVSFAWSQASAKTEIVVVYWSSKDCPYCDMWESASWGMTRLKTSEEYQKLKFFVVKNERLALPYLKEHFPPEITWVWERYQRGEKPPGRPGWTIYVDRGLVGRYVGINEWDQNAFPEIKRLVAVYANY